MSKKNDTSNMFPSEFSEESQQFFEVRGKAGDITKAIAMELINGAPLIESVRNRMTQGDLTAARELIAEAEASADTNFEISELNLEQTRLAFYEGRYQQATEYATQVLATSSWPLTHLSAYQLRAASFFELQQWTEALQDIRKAEALGSMYPDLPVTNNIKAIRMRSDLRKLSFEQGARLLSAWLSDLFTQNSITLDRLHQFERIRLDWLRLHQRDFYETAIKTYFYAVANSEDLFSAAGAFDVWTSLSAEARKVHFQTWAEPALKFSRIKKLNECLENTPEEMTETARNILEAWKGGRLNLPVDEKNNIPDVVLDMELKILVHLSKKTVTNLSEKPQLLLALKTLSKGPIEKDAFFTEVWKGLSYDRGGRDGAVRSLLLRLRKDFGFSIKTQAGRIHLLQSVRVIGTLLN